MPTIHLSFFLLLFSFQLATAQSDIYFINIPTGIERIDANGDNRQILVDTATAAAPQGITMDIGNGKLYWTDWVTKKIQRANFDGSEVEDLITTGLGLPEGIALDTENEKMYWVDSGTNKIMRANLDGTIVEALVTYPTVNLDAIVLDVLQGKMYWTLWGAGSAEGKIMRANLNGTNIEELVNIPNAILKGIDLDLIEGKMYWTDCGYAKIQRANLDGSNMEDLISTGLSTPNAISIDLLAQKIYWTDLGGRKIQGAKLDGTQVFTVSNVDINSPQGLVVYSDYYINSLATTEESSIEIFPNPVIHQLNLTELLPSSLINILNMKGQVLYQTETDKGTMTIDVSNYNAGFYLVEIVAPTGGKFIEKIIILK